MDNVRITFFLERTYCSVTESARFSFRDDGVLQRQVYDQECTKVVCVRLLHQANLAIAVGDTFSSSTS